MRLEAESIDQTLNFKAAESDFPQTSVSEIIPIFDPAEVRIVLEKRISLRGQIVSSQGDKIKKLPFQSIINIEKKPIKKWGDHMISNLRTVGEVCLQTVFEEYNKLDCTAKIVEEERLKSEFSEANLRYLFGFLAIQEKPLLPDVMGDLCQLKKNLQKLQENIKGLKGQKMNK